MTDFDEPLPRVLWILREYLPDLVLIGGWVPELYRRYGGFKAWASALSGTTEADVLVPTSMPRAERESIPEALVAAGFEPHGGTVMPATWTRDVAKGEKVEFLTAFQAPAMRRGRTITIEHQPGLGAMALPQDVSLLLRHTAVLSVPVLAGVEEALDPVHVGVRVPTLGAYVVNKALTVHERPTDPEGNAPKRSKDLLYLRDIAAAGPEVVSRVNGELAQLARSDSSSSLQLRRARDRMEAAVVGDIREAAETLSVRDGITQSAAESDIRGHLTDLLDLLRGRAGN